MQDTIHRRPGKNAQPEDDINFRRLVEAANDLSWVCRLDWTLTYISPQLQTLFGYVPEAWVGRSWMSLIHPEDFLRIEAVLQSVIKTGENLSGIEFRHSHKDGSWRWVSLNVALIQDNSGNTSGSAIGLQGIVRDIDDRKVAQAKLQEQEQFLQSVYEAVEHSITIVDVSEDGEFRFVGWNSSTEKTTGISSEAIVGQTPETLMGELHGKIVRQDYHRCLEAGTSITYEEYLPIGGRDFWWLTTLNPIKDDRGRICRIVVTSFDITDHKRVEAELKQKEAQYRSIFETLNDGILITDLETGQTVEANPAAHRIYGYTYEEFMQLEPSKFLHPDYIEHFPNFLATIRAGDRFFCETLNLHKDGSYIDIEVIGVPFLYNGKPHALSVFRDISDRVRAANERKAAEIALRQAEIHYRSIFEAINDGINIIDLETGRVVAVNPAFCQMHGYTAEEFLQLNSSEYIHADSFSKFSRFVETIEAGEQFFCEAINLHKDGTPIDIEVTAVPFLYGNKPCALSIIRDIRDRKAAEAALRQAEAHYRSIFESINDGISIVDLNTGKLISINPAFSRMHGYTTEEFLQLSPLEYVHPDSLPEFARFIETVKAGHRFFCEATDIHKDGTLINIEVAGVPFLYNGVPQALSIVRDVTDRVRAANEREVAEAALRQSELRFRTLVENGMSLVFEVSADGRFSFVSPNFTTMLGYTLAEIEGQPFAPLVCPEDLPICYTALQAVIEQGRSVSGLEYRVICKDGTLRYHSANVTPLRSAAGEIVALLGIASDMTDRKAAETAIKEANVLLTSVLEATPGFFFVKDLQGRHLTLNSNVAEFFGRPMSEIIGKTDAELLPPDLAIAIMHKDREILETELTQQFEVVIPIDGVDRTHLTTKTPLYNAQGSLIGLIGVVVDITDRKAAEQAQARLTAILEATSDVVGIADMQGRILYLNAAGHYLLEIPPEEDLVGLPVESLHPPAAQAFVGQQAIPIAIQQGIWQGESSVVTRNGNEIPVSQVVIAHKRADGTPEYVSTIIRNITAQKQSEMALQQKAQELETALQELQRTQLQMIQAEKMSSLGQLVAGVAHEINNPVNFIYGNLAPASQYIEDILALIDLYQEQYPNPLPIVQDKIQEIDLEFVEADLPRLLASMKMGADRIRQIVHSLRTFSRLDEAACKEVDIHEGIDSTLVILENRLKAKGDQPAIEVIKHYGDLPLVECYAGQLNQVFMNVLANALDALEQHNQHRSFEEIKASPSRIEIRTQVLSRDRVQIRFADNGIGIPEAVRQRIFDPFFTTKPVGKGTGMGMSISYQIITENHGGTLQCFSTPGQGAEFVIEIPLRQQVS